MKNIKLMLLSLALFAIISGALAFKIKFNTMYCTTNLRANNTCGSPSTCTIENVNSETLINGSGPFECYSTATTYTIGPNPEDVNIGCWTNIGNPAEGDYRTARLSCAGTAKMGLD